MNENRALILSDATASHRAATDAAGLCRDLVLKTAMKIQGSGWVYLSTSGDIKTIANHAVRTDICCLVDWWEHAWALDYQADKEAYLNNMWKIINWDVCNERL